MYQSSIFRRRRKGEDVTLWCMVTAISFFCGSFQLRDSGNQMTALLIFSCALIVSYLVSFAATPALQALLRLVHNVAQQREATRPFCSSIVYYNIPAKSTELSYSPLGGQMVVAAMLLIFSANLTVPQSNAGLINRHG